MNREEIESIYLELQKFLCDCDTIGKYHELLDELYLVAKTKITSSNNKYTAPQATPKLRKSCYIEESFCLYDENKMCEDCYKE